MLAWCRAEEVGSGVGRGVHSLHGMPIQPLEGHIPARQRLGRRGRRWCDRPRPQLLCGLPVWSVEGRTPRQRRRCRISALDADGWREVLQRQQMGSATTSVVSRTGQLQFQ
jgi:hypothetical protein